MEKEINFFKNINLYQSLDCNSVFDDPNDANAHSCDLIIESSKVEHINLRDELYKFIFVWNKHPYAESELSSLEINDLINSTLIGLVNSALK